MSDYQDLHDATILVVDDEDANLRLLHRVLTRAGFTRVYTAQEPRTVLQLHDALDPDLLILDVHMPELDGFGVLAALRSVLTPADFLPVLAVTGDMSHETRVGIIRAGAKDFLQKPFEPSEVVVRVHNLLTMRALHASLRSFLSSMSHELRTPLNSVIGFARQLEKNRHGRLEGTDLEYAHRIADNGEHMLAVVETLLERSRLESERLVSAALGREGSGDKH